MAESSIPTYGPDRESELAHLSASVGHHLINAFSAIVSNAEILSLEEAGADTSELAEVIINVALKASGVARRLIEFTRASTVPDGDPVELRTVLDDAVSALRDGAGRHVGWDVELGPPPPITGRSDHLRCMFEFLLTNAVEAIGSEGGTVRIRDDVEEPGWTTLIISDDGEGMDPAVQEQALEPFFSTKPGRLGIGLNLANGIWRRHGGTMAIRSRKGQGTEIRMTYGQ